MLIVDDDGAFRSRLRTFLEGVAREVVEASAGAEGLHLMAERWPDLVFLDLRMGQRRRRRSARRHVRRWKLRDVPVVLATSAEVDEERCRPLSAATCVSSEKPTWSRELVIETYRRRCSGERRPRPHRPLAGGDEQDPRRRRQRRARATFWLTWLCRAGSTSWKRNGRRGAFRGRSNGVRSDRAGRQPSGYERLRRSAKKSRLGRGSLTPVLHVSATFIDSADRSEGLRRGAEGSWSNRWSAKSWSRRSSRCCAAFRRNGPPFAWPCGCAN